MPPPAPPPRRRPALPAGLGLFLAALLLSAAADGDSVRLLAPRAGAALRQNTPTLAWAAPAADQIEVWIDGRRLETLAGDATAYVPVPLGFGRHDWHIVAVRGGARLASAPADFTIDDDPLAPLPPRSVLLRDGWLVQSSVLAGRDGAALSRPGADTAGWHPTSVPATVLTVLARNGVYPNPYFGLNNTRIPDAHDGFNRANDLLRFSHLAGRNPWRDPYWYRRTFTVPAGLRGPRLWLTFNEINYRAEVWLNGTRVAGPAEVVGMERAFRFDVTGLVRRDAANVLAVAIHPLDEPGLPAPAPVTPLADPDRNMGADTAISLNYTKWDTIGWDWQPEIRDRAMGITEDVFLSAGEDLELVDPYVTAAPGADEGAPADVALAVDLANHGAAPATATLEATIRDGEAVVARVARPVTIPAGAAVRLALDAATCPELRLPQPRLWWPAGLGEPHLYRLELALRTPAGTVDERRLRFGVRKVESWINPATQSRVCRINGRDVFVQGGNWVIDMMLNWTATRYRQEIALTRHAGLNFLRVWGPTGAPPESFYDAADEAGILLQQDFLNDFWGTEKNTPGCTPPADVFEAATTAIIKRYRNHPSLVIWCGGNEGVNPREELITRRLLPAHDPRGSRYYLPISNGDGLQGGGPYHTLPPREYFGNRKTLGFNSELGPSGVPEWESLRLFLPLPPERWAEGRFPLDGAWAYHDATDRASDNRKFSHHDNLVRRRYGPPASTGTAGVRDYARKAQMVNFETYRAALDALNKHRWSGATGFCLWKSNASWPSATWQLTDWYLRFHAGFYATRRALEPLHVQFNLDDSTVSAVNRTTAARPGCTVTAELFDAVSCRRLWSHVERRDLPADATVTSGWSVLAPTDLAFLRLRLATADGQTVSDNFYWLDPHDDFAALDRLPPGRLAATAVRRGDAVHVTLRNDGPGAALLTRLRLVDRDTGAEPLPAWWSDNYISLLPGETAAVAVRCEPAAAPAVPAVEISGYNAPVRLEPVALSP